MNRNRRWPAFALTAAAVLSASSVVAAPLLTFEITLDPKFQKRPYSGRVYVVLTTAPTREPRMHLGNWMHAPQVFSRDVSGLQPGVAVSLGADALAYPFALKDLPAGEYRIQGIARRNLDSPLPGRSAGDLISAVHKVHIAPESDAVISLHLNRMVEPNPFVETESIKLAEMTSVALSKFHGRDVKIRAGVALPEGWKDEPARKYPVLYMIPGFSGDHQMIRMFQRLNNTGQPGAGVILVVPDPSCFRGHSVFADSENNGPWGWALLHELIPEIERRFHGTESGDHRYVMGVSSGGWSSLWLQITYPESFNGCWSHTPDPVDFRDFQGINLYENDANMYTDGNGVRRPVIQRAGQTLMYYEDFIRMEHAMGPGGQIHSFEAVFSQRSMGGIPVPMFDPRTGRVNTRVARTWEPFDIRLVLEENWDELGPKLVDKLHIYGGRLDAFLLDGAVDLLKESLTKLGSNAEIMVIEDMGHGLYQPAIKTMFETIRTNFDREHGDGG